MAICLLCLVAIFVLQLRHSRPGADQVAPLRKRVTLGAQALLTYLPVMAFESQWAPWPASSPAPSCCSCPRGSPGRCTGPSASACWHRPRSTDGR